MQLCTVCQSGQLIAHDDVRTFSPPGSAVPVEVHLASFLCSNCHAKITSREQRAVNLKALADRKQHYGEWLMGEEILKLRKRYGITQQQASEIFGKGKIAFSRYETETVYPDLTLARMMKFALTDANFMKRLASHAGVDLPLLEKRLTEAFVQKMAGLENASKNLDTVSKTSIESTVGAKSNPFFATWRKFMSTSWVTDQSRTSDQIVCAANDERFALAA